MESSDILLQLKALQQAIQGTNSGNNGYIAQGQNQARQITSPLGKPVYGTEGTAPYIPFAPGTPTLAARQFTEQQDQNSIANRLNQAKYNLSVAKASGSGGGSGGGGAPKLNATERKNQILNSLVPGIMNAKSSGMLPDQVTSELYGSIGELGESVSTKDIDDLVVRLYGNGAAGGGTTNGGPFNGQYAEMTPEEILSKALEQRPVWQRAVDLLPGKQYR